MDIAVENQWDSHPVTLSFIHFYITSSTTYFHIENAEDRIKILHKCSMALCHVANTTKKSNTNAITTNMITENM